MLKNLYSIERSLKQKIKTSLFSQGYTFANNMFLLPPVDRERIRKIHNFPRAEKILNNINFIEQFNGKAKEFMRNSYEVDIQKIKPCLIQIRDGTLHSDLFRWWNLSWWSLPYEKAYGRQMRFMVWDNYHNAPIGLIGLQSPILKWSVRDQHLKIQSEQRDTLINQSMSAQRLGALPPYNKLLCGKLVASLMTSNFVRESFRKKYKDYKTLMYKRNLPARLLFITTTGAYGKSSVYNRLKDKHGYICEFIGFTNGSGSFHISNSLYEELLFYLRKKGVTVGRSFGSGPSAKMKNISQAMRLLGFKNGSQHGVKRAVYLFRLAKNLDNIIQYSKNPIWYKRSIEEITEHWKARWAVKRILPYCSKKQIYFSKTSYIKKLKEDIKNCKYLMKAHFK